ncbi:MAG: hypothetical protein PVI23_09875 [Maricaulaceae bacterium]|jgi:hypothetical protein
MPVRFVRELSRRRVLRGAATYVIIAWLALQLVALATEPADPLRRLALYWSIGLFPLAVVFSWVFRVTPGELSAEHADTAHPQRTWHGRALDFGVLGGFAVIVIVEAVKRLV